MHRDLKRQTRVDVLLLSIIAFLLAIIAFFSIAYYQSTKPIAQAKKEAVAVAKTTANVTTIEEFYKYSRKKTSYGILGKTKDNKEVLVLIPQSGKGVQTINPADGLTEQKAVQVVEEKHSDEQFVEANIGLEQDKPTWEIVTKSNKGEFNYYLVDFKDGKIVKSITNV